MSDGNYADIKNQLSKLHEDNVLLQKKFDALLAALTKTNFIDKKPDEPLPDLPTPANDNPKVVVNDRKDYMMVYRDSSGKISERNINVRKVYAKDGKLYISAYCYKRNRVKTFKASNIVSLYDNESHATFASVDDVFAELGRWMAV